MKIFQRTVGPACGAVALIHFVIGCYGIGLAILAWAQTLQNWNQLVALDHVHDVFGRLSCSSYDLVGLEFESYSTPIVYWVLELDLDGHWTMISWLDSILNVHQSCILRRRALGALSNDLAILTRGAAATAVSGLNGNGIAELERGRARLQPTERSECDCILSNCCTRFHIYTIVIIL